MIPVREFASAEELMAHYRAVNRRINSGRRPSRQIPMPVLVVAAEPVEERLPEPPKQPSVSDLLDSYRLVCRRLPYEEFQPPKLTVKLIAEYVSVAFGVTVLDLLSHRRSKPITQPRHAMFWLARHLTNRSLPDIGRRCGGRDHSTVLNGVNRCAEIMKRDPDFEATVLTIKERLEALA